ncbi:hypothetical protein BKA00_002872 [Actinomadura coerulea]|uniref:Uncharacterized protein n=1 Tax=Actinomadura coerulea TaxID=46159 RepID=A0A7X0KZ04_9ACTN|nr:hypothetical protein [Actinomadura coerulea]MBB6395958.1 hypothetical protein [Actinomadura coerulea]
MGVDHPGGPGEGPEPTDKPTPPKTGDEPPAPPGADGKTPRKDSLKAAGWQFDDQQEPGTDDSSADPAGEAKPETEEKTETGKPEADEPRPAGGTQETPRTQPADETAPQPPREQDGEGVGSTGHTDAGPPSRPQDNSPPSADPTDQPPGGEAPAVTEKGSPATDTGDPKPAEPANQDTPLPEPHAVDSDKPPAEGTGSGNEADGERDGKPVAPQPENTGDKTDTTDKADPGQLERTPYTDNPGSGTQPSRIATLIAAGWEFPGRTDNGSQLPETTDPKPEDPPKTDAPDPAPQTPETPPPSEQTLPADKPADTDPPAQPEQPGGTPEEPVEPNEGAPGDPTVEEPAAAPPGDGELGPRTPGDQPPGDAPPPLPNSGEQPPDGPEPQHAPEEPDPRDNDDQADPAGGERDGDHDKNAEEPQAIETGPNTYPYLGAYNPNGHSTQTLDQARRSSDSSRSREDDDLNTELPRWLIRAPEIRRSPTQDELDPTGANPEPGVAAKAPDRRKKSETDPESPIDRFRRGAWFRGKDMKDVGTLADDSVGSYLGPRPPAPTGHAETGTGPTYSQPHAPGATPDSFMAGAALAMVAVEATRKVTQIVSRIARRGDGNERDR